MAKNPALANITNILNAAATINNNNDLIETAFQNTLSRDGSSPNQMEGDLDLNSNNLLNIGELDVLSLRLGGELVTSVATVPEWQGAWVTSTSYVLNDMVRSSSSTYICIEAHTSDTFSTDLANLKWELMAQQGAAGDGTGDMLAANDLSDVDDAPTALANIGGQPINATLTSVAALGIAAINEGLASYSYGATAPTTIYANMLWYDTTANALKMRSEANDAWIILVYLDQTTNEVMYVDDRSVWNGTTEIARIGVYSDATWEAGTQTTNALVSPAKVKLAVKAHAGLIARITLNQATDTIIQSYGVSSIANQATGRTRIYLSETQPNNKYQVVCTTTGQGGDVTSIWSAVGNFGASANKTTSYFDIYSTTGGGVAMNSEYVCVLVFGD